MKRPGGVTLISLLLWLVAAVNLIQGVASEEAIQTIGFLAVAVLTAACAWGCWQLMGWARITTIVLMALNAIFLIGVWVQYSDRIIVSRVVVPLALNVAIAAYLMGTTARRAFASRRESAPSM